MPGQTWNDQERAALHEQLRRRVLGELRLNRSDRETLESDCFEYQVQDVCPEDEQEAFRAFISEEIERVSAELKAAQAHWPELTDCDRLDRVEAALRERGIVFWQASPCCDSCSGGELWDRIDWIDERFPGFRDQVRGYAFFIDQNLPDDLAESERVTVHLAYGAFVDEVSAEDVFEEEGLRIGREVSVCLQQEGLEPDWDGKTFRKIGVAVEWRRRGMLK